MIQKFKPILFSTPMVQAIQEDRKIMTRRIVKSDANNIQWQPIVLNGYGGFCDEHGSPVKCKYEIGDVLWVRETWRKNKIPTGWPYHFYADDNVYTNKDNEKWKPSIFMPKSACRIFLEITDVSVERLQDISEGDAKAEGVESCIADKERFGCRAMGMRLFRDYDRKDNSLKNHPCNGFNNAKLSFQSLWESINGPESWKANPWVWVISFKIITKPENFNQ